LNPKLLPIYEIEPALEDAARAGNRIIVQAPTGSGKSTQVPQILLDRQLAGGGQIVVLQPRRLATRMLARRVAQERRVELGKEVGYHIRLDQVCGALTRIKFVTEGVLLRYMLDDEALEGIGCLVFDEFHERHLYSDITLGRALELQKTQRPDLKIVVMSATLDTELTQKYLEPCRVLQSAGQTFPVEISYLGKESDLPVWELAAWELEHQLRAQPEGDALIFMPGAYEINRTIQAVQNTVGARDYLILPLHGELPAEQQDAAVEPNARRKIIVSTNVAETSLTIDGVRIVIDSGLARIARYDSNRGINTLLIEKISRASADQRAGRAGRTAPGVCARLWTMSDQRHRAAQETPEIRRVDLSEVALSLKAMGYADLGTFGWLEAPEEKAVARAQTLLRDVGATDADGKITQLGRRMLAFPLHPRYARMLIAAQENKCVRPVALIAALTQGRPILMRSEGRKMDEAREILTDGEGSSDFFVLMRAWQWAQGKQFDVNACRRLGIHAGAAREVGRLFEHFLRIAKNEGMDVEGRGAPEEVIRKCVLMGFSDHLARRLDSGTLRCDVVHGRRGTLTRDSVAQAHPLFVAAEMREVEGRAKELDVILSLATAIEESWLRELYPTEFSQKLETSFDSTARRVVAAEVTRFRDLVLRSKASDKVDLDAAARLLADEVLSGRCPLKGWDEAVEQWIERVNCLRAWRPDLELPEIDAQARRAMVEQICHGATGYKEIKDAAVWPVVKDWLSAAQLAAVESMAPERYALPGGRKAKIVYFRDKNPVVSARIADLYGVERALTIAGGQVTLTVEILAPNNRPVQVTQNLGDFWRDSYPKIKQELKRKYPKHEWR
jgi:ATP-dependent helicase HrpB